MPPIVWLHPPDYQRFFSSLQVLHDLKVLTKIDPPPLSSQNTSAGFNGAQGAVAPLELDPLAYCHESSKTPHAVGDESGVEGIGAGSSAIEQFHKAMAEAAEVHKSEVELGKRAGLPAIGSMRGLRRDKKARSAAAEALINVKVPPQEMKMGLGWGCLHVDVPVFLANEKVAYKRVEGHMQWCDFWSTYQVGAMYSGLIDLWIDEFGPCDAIVAVCDAKETRAADVTVPQPCRRTCRTCPTGLAKRELRHTAISR